MDDKQAAAIVRAFIAQKPASFNRWRRLYIILSTDDARAIAELREQWPCTIEEAGAVVAYLRRPLSTRGTHNTAPS